MHTCDEEAKCDNEENGTTLLTINVRKDITVLTHPVKKLRVPFLVTVKVAFLQAKNPVVLVLSELYASQDDNYYLEGDTNTRVLR